VRRLIFVRHGQYDEAVTGALTPLGRRQAARTAEALRMLDVSAIWSSTLLRAKETATIVAERQPRARFRRTNLLCEVVPTTLPPKLARRFFVDGHTAKRDRARADRAYTALFRVARRERTEIVVCHGNLIRYLVCRALGIRPKLWMRLDSTHCGLTEFRVLPRGVVRVVRYNDVGHIPAAMRTQAGAAQPA
jgi:serine/threonine-protein phosphatase PGAM5